MTNIIRLGITVCVLLLVCASSNAQTTDQAPLDRVISEMQAGLTEKALAALDDLIKEYPNNPDAYFLRGSLKMQADPSQALADFDKVIELRPDSGPAYNQRAWLRLIKNDRSGALKDLDAAILHDFKDDSIYYLRGQLRWESGELNAALGDLDEALKLNPGNPRLYSTRSDLLLELKEFDRALADLNYLIGWYETDPSARPISKPSEGDKPKPTKAPAEAKTASKPFMVEMAQQTTNEAPGAKEMAPTIANAYVKRGFLWRTRGNHAVAISDFDKAVRINPANQWALYYRAIEYEFKGELSAALADITKAIQIDSKNGDLLVEHGVLLLLLGQEKEAQADFDVLLKSDHALWQNRIDERVAAIKKLLPPK